MFAAAYDAFAAVDRQALVTEVCCEIADLMEGEGRLEQGSEEMQAWRRSMDLCLLKLRRLGRIDLYRQFVTTFPQHSLGWKTIAIGDQLMDHATSAYDRPTREESTCCLM